MKHGTMRGVMMALVAAISLAGVSAEATPTVAASAPKALERSWSAGVYGSATAGSYEGLGSGGVLRWEAFPGTAGVEVFGTRTRIAWPDGLREDDVGGFTIYTPFNLGSWARLRLGGGFCSTVSRIEPLFSGGPRNDALLLGTHLSAAIDVGLGRWISLFAQARGFVYRGRDRTIASQTAQGTLAWQPSVHADIGLAFHFGS